jgi:hypothetical protein
MKLNSILFKHGVVVAICLMALAVMASPTFTQEREPHPLPEWLAELLEVDREAVVPQRRAPSGAPVRNGKAAPAGVNPSLTVDGDVVLADAGNVFKGPDLFLWDDGGSLNLALGRQALISNTTGASNTALGSLALSTNTAGSRNTAVGANSLRNNVYENYNTAVGYQALYTSYDGRHNTAVGSYALASNTYSNSNTAVGSNAMRFNISGYHNVAVGYSALVSNSYGSNNVAIGDSALSYNTTGDHNVAIGTAALAHSEGASFNTGVGFLALEQNTTGQGNTGIGNQALRSNLYGISNTAVGAAALYDNANGDNNTALGVGALAGNTTGDGNLALGHRAGYNARTMDDNVFVANEGTLMDAGTIRIGTGGTHTRVFLAGVHMTVLSDMGEHVVCVDSAGQLGECTATKSSERFKEGVREMGNDSDGIFELRPVSFRYRDSPAPNATEYGLLAEEVARVYPHLVRSDGDGRPHAVRYQALASLLLNELQKQRARIDELEARLIPLRSTGPSADSP